MRNNEKNIEKNIENRMMEWKMIEEWWKMGKFDNQDIR